MALVEWRDFRGDLVRLALEGSSSDPPWREPIAVGVEVMRNVGHLKLDSLPVREVM